MTRRKKYVRRALPKAMNLKQLKISNFALIGKSYKYKRV